MSAVVSIVAHNNEYIHTGVCGQAVILCYLHAVSVQCVFNSQPCEAVFI